ncbi:MAG: serine--tRNA ligase [Endomicrobium sp.]|jgi:seryl-tRNA synthetase|nr:serine--tRNA ligase [Endomicrobium sp.]
MLDIKFIRENLKKVKQAMLNRNISIDLEKLLNLDDKRKILITKIEQLRSKRNTESKKIGKYKITGKKPSQELLSEINKLRNKIQKYQKQFLEIKNQTDNLLLRVPNIPDENVPIGKNNKIIKFIGKPKKFSFHPKQHWEIGEQLDILDFIVASKISGSRFVILKNEGCALERAIINFFLDTHKAKGYKEIMTPYLVNQTSMIGTGQFPEFEEEVFKCSNELYLIPTAEVSVTNIYRDVVLEESILPEKYVSYSACFRRESGTYGKDTRGLIRNHQFNKVELVKFVKPETSNEELESLVNDAENILKLLNLPYRVMLLSTEDISFTSSKTYDLEVWFAGNATYREISSCSNFKDFQARRMNIKIKLQNKKKEFLHTLNASGVAVGRTFAAILENYQQKDGSVLIPEVLRKYTGFDIISPKF